MEPLVLALAVLAAVGLIVAVSLALGRHRRGTVAFDGMKAREFESLVAEAFRSQGYQPVGTPHGEPAATMAGALVLRRDRTTFLVECRHWKSGKVDVDAVHALQRAMAARGASAGFVLSGGRCSRAATAFAAGCGIQLIGGPALQAMVRRAKAP